MILKAKHNIIIYPFFKWYSIFKINRIFNKINIEGKFYDKKLSILLISNHFCWWDGFFAMLINLKFFKRKFFFMMLEKQLKKYWFFNYSGGYSIKKKHKSIIESLNYTKNILENNKNMVLIFPQGKINSIYEHDIKFEKGLHKIIDGKTSTQIIFMVNLIDYFSSPKPDLYIYFKEFEYKNNYDLSRIEGEYNVFFRTCIEKQKLIAE